MGLCSFKSLGPSGIYFSFGSKFYLTGLYQCDPTQSKTLRAKNPFLTTNYYQGQLWISQASSPPHHWAAPSLSCSFKVTSGIFSLSSFLVEISKEILNSHDSLCKLWLWLTSLCFSFIFEQEILIFLFFLVFLEAVKRKELESRVLFFFFFIFYFCI